MTTDDPQNQTSTGSCSELHDSTAPIGLIAGNGRLPFLFALAAREQGHEVVALALRGETDETLGSCVDQMHWISIGQPSKCVELLKKRGVKTLVFAGGVSKLKLLKNTRFDLGALKVLASARSFRDDALLRAIAQYFESNGIKICAPTDILSDLLAPEGMLTKGKLTAQQEKDVALGNEVVALLGRADVGQVVIVKDGIVFAVEAAEGTDACIQRGADLAGPGIVVVKRCKPTQDKRFDLPTLGPRTIEVIAKAKGAVLAIHAGETIVIDAPQVIAAAEKAGVAIVASP
ncbi:MAG: UDP-2,3-diacylglucosamine diphosphatase LpxI [Myxococcales bacterium]|jgi:DUF1009 family protein|nr:UDP-2,3-diacylglucosamine diphosphatase LpxI [Myxococcales bacterium]